MYPSINTNRLVLSLMIDSLILITFKYLQLTGQL